MENLNLTLITEAELKSLKKGDFFTIGKSKKIYEFIWVYTMNGKQKAIYWNEKGITKINNNINLIVKKHTTMTKQQKYYTELHNQAKQKVRRELQQIENQNNYEMENQSQNPIQAPTEKQLFKIIKVMKHTDKKYVLKTDLTEPEAQAVVKADIGINPSAEKYMIIYTKQ